MQSPVRILGDHVHNIMIPVGKLTWNIALHKLDRIEVRNFQFCRREIGYVYGIYNMMR